MNQRPGLASGLLLLAAALMLSVGVAPSEARAAPDDIVYENSEIWIETGEQRHHFNIEMARTRKQKARGLMFRKELADDAGMLFDYDPPARFSMWMKNTLIPLDMLFVDPEGIVRRVVRWTTPLSLTPIPSGGAARAVIELKGGVTERLGIDTGSRVIHPMFGNDS